MRRLYETATVILSRHLPIVVIVASVSVNLLLATKLMRAQNPVAPSLAVGSVIDPIVGETPDGKPVTVAFSEPTILYYFSPTCSWCERNWGNIKGLVAETKGRYRFVGISTADIPREFLAAHGLQMDAAAIVSSDIARRYKLNGTPQTLIVSTSGRVLQTWTGAYQGSQAREIELYFGLTLPGLLTPPAGPRP